MTRPHGFLFAVCIPLVMGFAVPALGQNEPAPSASAPSVSAPGTDFLDAYRQTATQRWEQAIQAMETRDRTEADPADSILFIGSSSIRRWDDIAIDMAPYRIIQRGYGGAKYSDLAVYAERLIRPHQYRGLVIFVANDVSGSPSDQTEFHGRRPLFHGQPFHFSSPHRRFIATVGRFTLVKRRIEFVHSAQI